MKLFKRNTREEQTSETTIGTTLKAAKSSDRNPTVEAFIKTFNVNDWQFAEVQLADIDDKASRDNQARNADAPEATVRTYALAAASIGD